jgi:hypothetical protein
MTGRTVTIDVTINSINPLDFTVEPSPKNKPPLVTKGGKPGQPQIEFHNNGHAGFDIYFELQGDTHGYFFPPSPHDACWSKCGSKCPKTEVWEVFEPKQVLQNNIGERRTLRVYNANPPSPPAPKPQGEFMYYLRVTDGHKWIDLDPGGDNTDGSYTKFTTFMSVGTVAVTTAVLTAAATVAAIKFSLVCPAMPGL